MKLHAFTLSLFVAGCASAAPPADVPIGPPEARVDEVGRLIAQETMDERTFLRLVALNHPRVRAAERDVEAAAARGRQAGLWPNPTLFASVEEAPTRKPGDAKAVIGLTYPLSLSGRRGAAVEVAERERTWAAARVAGQQRDLVAEARLALYDYTQAREAVGLEHELRRIAASFRDAVAKRRAEKSVLEVDLLKTAVELAEQEIASDSIERDVQQAAIRLRRFTGIPDFDVDRIRCEPPSSYALRPLADGEKATETHPLVRAAAAAVDVARAERELASRQGWPDVELSAAVGRSAGADSSERETILEFGVSVPLPIFDRNQGRVAETEILVRKAELELEDARLAVRARLHEAYREVERQLARVARYRDAILPPATAAVDQVTTLYREGKALVLDVLDAQRVLASSRRALLGARRDLATAIVVLESLTGDQP